MSRVECSTGNITITAYAPYPATNLSIGGLLEATTYAVRVAVNNSAGLGEYSSPDVFADTDIALGKYIYISEGVFLDDCGLLCLSK